MLYNAHTKVILFNMSRMSLLFIWSFMFFFLPTITSSFLSDETAHIFEAVSVRAPCTLAIIVTVITHRI